MNKMWPVLATVGVGAAVWGLSKYRGGKYMQPVQEMMGDAKDMVSNMGTQNPLMEISKELMPNEAAKKLGQNTKFKNQPINPS